MDCQARWALRMFRRAACRCFWVAMRVPPISDALELSEQHICQHDLGQRLTTGARELLKQVSHSEKERRHDPQAENPASIGSIRERPIHERAGAETWARLRHAYRPRSMSGPCSSSSDSVRRPNPNL